MLLDKLPPRKQWPYLGAVWGSCLGLLSVLIGGVRRWQPDIRAAGHMFHIERQGDTWFAEGTIRFHTTVDKH